MNLLARMPTIRKSSTERIQIQVVTKSRHGLRAPFSLLASLPTSARDASLGHASGTSPLRQLQTFYSFVGTHLPTTQFSHARHAQIARRANLSHASALAASGKSQRCSRASRLDEEGRFGRSSRYVGRGCGGRCGHVRRTWPEADGEVVWSWRSEAGAKFLRSKLLRDDGGNQAKVTGESAI